MRKRTLLVAALGGLIGLLRTDRPEAAVNTSLYFDPLDDDQFPELKPGPGRKGIQARVMQPPVDPRIPAPPKAIALLVVFRLDEPPRVADPDTAPSGWQLSFDLQAADAKILRHTIALMPRPKDGNFTQRPIPDGSPPLPGTIYRGALWADLGELYARGVFRPGMAIEVSFLQQAQTRVVLA